MLERIKKFRENSQNYIPSKTGPLRAAILSPPAGRQDHIITPVILHPLAEEKENEDPLSWTSHRENSESLDGLQVRSGLSYNSVEEIVAVLRTKAVSTVQTSLEFSSSGHSFELCPSPECETEVVTCDSSPSTAASTMTDRVAELIRKISPSPVEEDPMVVIARIRQRLTGTDKRAIVASSTVLEHMTVKRDVVMSGTVCIPSHPTGSKSTETVMGPKRQLSVHSFSSSVVAESRCLVTTATEAPAVIEQHPLLPAKVGRVMALPLSKNWRQYLSKLSLETLAGVCDT